MGYNKNPYTISPFCFSGCSSLTTLNIPSGIKKLECSSFAECTSLTTVNIPDTLEDICPPWVFESDGVEEEYYLFGNAFQKDVNLKTFNVDNNNIYFSSEGNVLYNKEKNKIVCYPSVTGTYTIPSTIKTIEKLAFDSTLIEKVIIPESVTLIDKFAFNNCVNLIEVNIIGKSLTFISDGTFKSCSAMTTNNIL